LFGNLGDRVAAGESIGLLGLAFPPQYGEGGAKRAAFVAYTAAEGEGETPVGRSLVLRVSRFHVEKAVLDTAPEHETILLRVPLPKPTDVGGALAFGADRALYVAIGAAGAGAEMEAAGGLLGKVVRLEPSATTAEGSHPQAFAIGFRAPAGLAAHPGQPVQFWLVDRREKQEVHLIRAGYDGGFPKQQTGARAISVYGDANRVVVGGVVVQGKELPGLTGAYVFADGKTGEFYAVGSAGEQKQARLLLRSPLPPVGLAANLEGSIRFINTKGSFFSLVKPADGDIPAAAAPDALATARSAPSEFAPVLQVLLRRCTGCHVNRRQAGLSFKNELAYAQLVDAEAQGRECKDRGWKRVVPGAPAHSLLYVKITGGDRLCGSPMPQSGESLSNEEKDLIRKWIEAGARR
jgi:hypothetical protein